ncbi:MAG: zinc-binding dehydrogenase [Nesterenkonia sp.]
MIITIRGYDEPGERGIRFQPVWVRDYARARQKLDELSQLAQEQKLTLRVADTPPKDQAAEAHRRLEGGGVRGRLVLEF